MLSFQITDARLYRWPSLHPAPEAFNCSSTPALVNMNLNATTKVMAPIAHINKCMLGFSGYPVYLFQAILQGMAIIRVGMVGLCFDKPATTADSCHTDFTTKFRSLVCFSFADTLYFRCMNAIDLILVISVLK
jgi:hypothetical protein